ncbi:MAG: hypothetical protein IPN15_16400 [Saprospiraceae bacterium]|nr:hypothetical protein [Candidatus Vicinibacter affinis]
MESKSGLDVFLFMNGRDKLMDGKGEMKIQILGLLNVVDDKDNPKINTGSAIRIWPEICWFPPAALNKNIRWTAMVQILLKPSWNFPMARWKGFCI